MDAMDRMDRSVGTVVHDLEIVLEQNEMTTPVAAVMAGRLSDAGGDGVGSRA